jgi:MFS family permease
MADSRGAAALPVRTATSFVVLVGVVSLFADMTYEGARSVAGPFLGLLGATGAVVGIVSGLGELAGYAVRLLSGYLGDRTGRYWAVTIVGYAINMLAVPALALAGRWEAAAALLVVERVGKGIRTPPRDVLLSHVAAQVGRGWAFGLHEALDQAGAVAGPLLVAALLGLGRGYQEAFAALLAPALLALLVLGLARARYPEPQRFEPVRTGAAGEHGFPRAFWTYVAAVACLAVGFADFPLIAFHLKTTGVAGDGTIPVLFALAMAVDGLAALAFGRAFDRRPLPTLIAVPLASGLFAPLAFSGRLGLAALGAVLWGVGMGAQESVLRAAVAQMVPPARRGTAYGVFNTVYGVAWFAGSAAMGVLYDVSLPALMALSVASQLAAVPILLSLRK